MTHPNCDHDCTSDCRREGCNCLCGEYHDSATAEEIEESLADELRETRIDTVKMLLRMYVQGESARKLASDIVDNLFTQIDPVAVNELAERN